MWIFLLGRLLIEILTWSVNESFQQTAVSIKKNLKKNYTGRINANIIKFDLLSILKRMVL